LCPFSTSLPPTSQPELQYNIALCFYKTRNLGLALKNIAEIIERGVRDHPELSVGRCVCAPSPRAERGQVCVCALTTQSQV